jgi:hypothetical protein
MQVNPVNINNLVATSTTNNSAAISGANLTKLIPEIQVDFENNYNINLSSFYPIIHQAFLDRVSYTDETFKKTPVELTKDQTNVDFRKQIYLDFVLNRMKEIFEKQSIDEGRVDEIYQKYNYDISFDIMKPIQSIIKDSIITKYDRLRKDDIKLYQIDSHGTIKRNIKKLQDKCIVVLITPLNRNTYSVPEHLKSIDRIISKISTTLNDSNNNIYDIIKMIKSYNCFDKSTIIYPNQYYFDYKITTGGNCKGGACFNSNSKQFQTLRAKFDTTLGEYIDSIIGPIIDPQTEIIKSKSVKNKVNVFFVRGCRNCNAESYDNFTIEKMYIYDNFINLLNSSIYEKLSVTDFPIDSSIDCKIRIETKGRFMLLDRINEDDSKELILNTSLGSKISDTELYKSFLIRITKFNIENILPTIIYNLLSKNKINTKFSKIIDADVMIEFMRNLKQIINDEPETKNRQFYILNIYILLFYIINNFDDSVYKLILKNLSTEFDIEYKKYKTETKIDIDINIFKNLLIFKNLSKNKSDKTFNEQLLKVLSDLCDLCVVIEKNFPYHDDLYDNFAYNLFGIIEFIILENLSNDNINNDPLLLEKINHFYDFFDMEIIKNKMDQENLNHNIPLYKFVLAKIKALEPPPPPKKLAPAVAPKPKLLPTPPGGPAPSPLPQSGGKLKKNKKTQIKLKKKKQTQLKLTKKINRTN